MNELFLTRTLVQRDTMKIDISEQELNRILLSLQLMANKSEGEAGEKYSSLARRLAKDYAAEKGPKP